MRTKSVATKEAAELFSRAIAVFLCVGCRRTNDGSIEPCIVQRHSIGAACDFVQAFDDPMPENAYELLVSLAAAHAVPAPADRSYASGATCLRTLRDQHLRRLE